MESVYTIDKVYNSRVNLENYKEYTSCNVLEDDTIEGTNEETCLEVFSSSSKSCVIETDYDLELNYFNKLKEDLNLPILFDKRVVIIFGGDNNIFSLITLIRYYWMYPEIVNNYLSLPIEDPVERLYYSHLYNLDYYERIYYSYKSYGGRQSDGDMIYILDYYKFKSNFLKINSELNNNCGMLHNIDSNFIKKLQSHIKNNDFKSFIKVMKRQILISSTTSNLVKCSCGICPKKCEYLTYSFVHPTLEF